MKLPRLLEQINPKAAEKFCARLRLFKIPVLSVKARSIAFNTFAHSVILYTIPYFGTAQADLAMLRGAAVDLLIGRSWIRHDMLAYVFRWLKISPLLDPGLSILVSALGLYLRKGGQLHELYAEKPPPENRQPLEVRSLWQSWARVVGEHPLTVAINRQGTIPKKIAAAKTGIMTSMKEPAQHYVQDKVATSGWPGGISAQWLDGMALCSERWAELHDMQCFDGLLMNRMMSGCISVASKESGGKFIEPSCAFPLGGNQWSQCESCIGLNGLNALNLPHCSPSVSDRTLEERQFSWAPCVACQKGDNTVGQGAVVPGTCLGAARPSPKPWDCLSQRSCPPGKQTPCYRFPCHPSFPNAAT